MKPLITLIFFCCLTAYSQTSGSITYKSFFSEKQATEELKVKDRMWYQLELDREMMAQMLRFKLDFNQDESMFYLADNMISDNENKNTKKYVTGLFYGLDYFYINRTKDTLVEQLQYSFATLLKKRKASFANWNLTNETKTIEGYTCYKATYTYIQKWNGREFEWPVVAWYCPEIPIPLGPIRYSGLPGLILELHEKETGYVVEKIDFHAKEIKIKEPKEGENLTDDEIKNRDRKVKESY
ncbi:GLPGLI family protein [Flavobacterium chuncheonense]|uniref:GLPGLI family protein n=1 Tax=Flavobacterium chuncheonense TaxID=2026653 RepID=A0ABW5YMJ3_9FLAO